jgi:hypothetical protein
MHLPAAQVKAALALLARLTGRPRVLSKPPERDRCEPPGSRAVRSAAIQAGEVVHGNVFWG